MDGLNSRMERTEEIITIIINRGQEESFIGDGCVYGIGCDGFMVNMYPQTHQVVCIKCVQPLVC